MTEPVLKIEGYDGDGHLIDTIGRRHPTPFNMIWAFRAVPGMAQQFKRQVPGDFFAEDVDADGEHVVVVACPCGDEPRIRRGSIEECACERFYLNLSTSVRVANSPADRAEDDEDDQPAEGVN